MGRPRKDGTPAAPKTKKVTTPEVAAEPVEISAGKAKFTVQTDFMEEFRNMTLDQRREFLRDEENAERLRQEQGRAHRRAVFPKTTTLKCRMTLLTPLLGTLNANPDIYKDYILTKAGPDDQVNEELELASLPPADLYEKAITVFARTAKGDVALYAYSIRGAMKEAAQAMKRAGATTAGTSIKDFNKVINQTVFVYPMKIKVDLSGPISVFQRPLRASSPSGENVALAASEMIPEGSSFEFEIDILNPNHVDPVKEWLEYVANRGTGQWRSSGKGITYIEWLEE